MGALAGMTTIKRITYRGNTMEEFSNTYHFDGSVPGTVTEWRALFDALTTQERGLFAAGDVTIVGGYGYADDAPDAHSVWSVDLTQAPNSPLAGNLTGISSMPQAPGDAAMWVRWLTSRRNTNGKPIYLRKYFHGIRLVTALGGDAIHATQVGALSAFGGKMRDGTFLDGRRIRSRAHPETILGSGSSTYATTRTLKRRGRRPH